MRLRTAAVSFLLAVTTTAAFGTTIVMPSDEQLIAKSPVILIGDVLSSSAVNENGAISTVTRIRVERTLKGAAPPVVTVREIGGRVGDRFNVVFGSPEYRVSERVLVFLWPADQGEFQTMDLFAGKLTERVMADGRRIWFRNEDRQNTHILNSDLKSVPSRNIQRLEAAFTSFVADRAAGRPGVRNYEIENPRLGKDQIQANFTLMSEPTIYRWFAFDNGGGATWRSVGTQPGFSGGGMTEASSAMTAWNNAPNTRIRFLYGGTSTAPTSGLSAPNGVNEILFNDPKGEISGSYSSSTGGVVGRGGFNNVVAGGSWTSGFHADPQHPAATYSNVGNIAEGNLVLQDGITANNFPSALFTAVISHEFGHTLGFGHSTDPGALMYATLGNGHNGALRSDDQNAARWLYPGSTEPTPPPPPPPPAPSIPAAPSNLTATVVNGQIQLNWKINATNATSQSVYVAANNSAFHKVGDVGSASNAAMLSNLGAGITYQARVTARNSAGESQPSNTAQATVPAPTQNPTVLPLGSDRFRVTLEATDQRTARRGAGISIPQNDLFGYFSIPDLTGNPDNPEVFVKMLDGGPVNGRYWVFYGGLTDLEYVIRVTDLSTGSTKSYVKEAGSACGGFDTSAFTSAVVQPITAEPQPQADLPSVQLIELSANACTQSGSTLCVNSGRFSVRLHARDHRTDRTGTGMALPQNDLFGYFSIPDLTSNAANPEVFVKVLDGRAVNGRWWVFYGGLTDLEYTVTVTDTVTGAVRQYSKPAGSSCGGFDTSAF